MLDCLLLFVCFNSILPYRALFSKQKITLLRVIPTMAFQNRHSSGILIWHSIWHSIWRSIWHSYLAFLSGILIWHSSLAFYLALYLTFYLAFYLAYLLAFSPAVEVRQGTLGVDSRGWGPAGNTGRGWSRLRSGREHLAWILAVEVRQGTLGVDSRGWGPAGNTLAVEVRQGTLGVDGRGWGPEEAEGGRRRKAAEVNWHKI